MHAKCKHLIDAGILGMEGTWHLQLATHSEFYKFGSPQKLQRRSCTWLYTGGRSVWAEQNARSLPGDSSDKSYQPVQAASRPVPTWHVRMVR